MAENFIKNNLYKYTTYPEVFQGKDSFFIKRYVVALSC